MKGLINIGVGFCILVCLFSIIEIETSNNRNKLCHAVKKLIKTYDKECSLDEENEPISCDTQDNKCDAKYCDGEYTACVTKGDRSGCFCCKTAQGQDNNCKGGIGTINTDPSSGCTEAPDEGICRQFCKSISTILRRYECGSGDKKICYCTQ